MQLIVLFTGDCEFLPFEILKAFPFDIVFVKPTFSIFLLLKRLRWLLG